MKTKIYLQKSTRAILLLLLLLLSGSVYAQELGGEDASNPRWGEPGHEITWDATKAAFKIKVPFYYQDQSHYAQSSMGIRIKDPAGTINTVLYIASNGWQSMSNNTFKAVLSLYSVSNDAEKWGVFRTANNEIGTGSVIEAFGIESVILSSNNTTAYYAYAEAYWYPPQRFIDHALLTGIEFQIYRRHNPAYRSYVPFGSEDAREFNYEITIEKTVHTPTINGYNFNSDGTITLNYSIADYSDNTDKGGSNTGDYVKGKLEVWNENKSILYASGEKRASGTITIEKDKVESFINNGMSICMRNWRRGHYGSGIHQEYSDAIKIPPYHQVKEFYANTIYNQSKIELKWQLHKTTVESSSPRDNIIIEYKKSTESNWNSVADIAWDNKFVSDVQTTDFIIPDLNAGQITYNFRIKRKSLDWDVFDKTSNVTVNTNPRQITGGNVRADDTDAKAKLSWDLETDGIWNGNWKYELLNNGTIDNNVSIANDAVSASASILSCTPTVYTLRVTHNNTVLSSYAFKSISVNLESKGIIKSLKSSKGFYRDRVKLEWQIDSANDNFNYYTISRKNKSTNEKDYTYLDRREHMAGTHIYKYEDTSVSPGDYYEYEICGWSTCDDEATNSAQQYDIGFAQPLGVLSGRILDKAGTAVQNVEVMVLSDDILKNQAMFLEGLNEDEGTITRSQIEVPIEGALFNAPEFSFQVWAKYSGINLVDRQANFYGIEGYHDIHINTTNNRLRLYYMGSTVTFNYTFPENEFKHITVTIKNGSAVNTKSTSLYIDGKLEDQQEFTPANTMPDDGAKKLFIGDWRNRYGFKGSLDEVRFWNIALDAETIKNNYSRFISGSETGLFLYYRFDERGDINQVFDISSNNGVYNEHHGVLQGGTRRVSDANLIPSNNQLSIKGVTNANGSYLINTIPYTEAGSQYRIIPTLGVHQFDPPEETLFYSSSSPSKDQNFTDISSFTVTGTVMYAYDKDTPGTYPVEGCQFEVDDRILTYANGTPVTSDANGSFSIQVPIGKQKVRIVKTGHTFLNDGLLLDGEGNNLNYNDDLSNVTFYDLTRIKLIGRVVGGLTEYDKPLGFGESLNNLGVTTITLTAAKKNFKLPASGDEEVLHNQGEWKKPNSLQNDKTIVNYGEENITITLSPETGEFVAWVYPEVYTIKSIGKLEGYEEDIMPDAQTINLSTAPVLLDDMLKTSIRPWTESEYVSRPGQVPGYEDVEKSDTIRYHAEWKHCYQATPTFTVKQVVDEVEIDWFGDEEFILTNPDGQVETIPLRVNNQYTFQYPVFTQGKEYTFALEAFEEYKNAAKNETYKYDISGGTVNFSNDLALDRPEPIELDSLGKAQYIFMPGAPSLTTGEESMKAFYATVRVGNFSYYWQLGDQSIKGWILGDKSTGTNFMTAGPNHITAILRDPPGSKSFAWIEKNTMISNRISAQLTTGLSQTMNFTAQLGPTITTFAGIGGGIITDQKTVLDVSAGLKTEMKMSAGLETVIASTFTERFETSPDPLYVGHLGDVFIGNSTNIQYGLTNAVSIQKNYQNSGAGDAFFKPADGDYTEYSIAPSMSLAYGQTFDTRFVYTEIEIEEIMIPKWKQALGEMLITEAEAAALGDITSPVYVSVLPHDDPNFGKLNSDPVFGKQAENICGYGAPSYNIIFPTGYDKELFLVDSVMWINNQITGWTETLARNEEEKVKLIQENDFDGNYSFGGGSVTEWSKTTSASLTVSVGFDFLINPTIGLEAGAEVMGIGMKATTQTEIIVETSANDEFTTETSIHTGFHLEDEGDDDQITVDYGVTESGTIAFRTRGGQTSCPYEDERRTRYFEPGEHVLSEATMQIEVPRISIDGATSLLNVPANRTANFALILNNESEINEDLWFQLIVDESSNSYGAELKIDGIGIGNGRNFLVKAGESLRKILTVGRGAGEDDIFEDIGIILRSECQNDPTGFWPVIADTTYISVEFIPACSDVEIIEPNNNWIVNTSEGDIMPVILGGFDTNFANFGYIKLDYRSATSPDWINLQNFYASEELKRNDAMGTLIDGTKQNITYDWNMRAITDGNYEIRATSVCIDIDGDGNLLGILSENTTESVSGTKDMSRPQPLGNPSPVNGILTASDEISITFNEEIQTGMLTKNNFSIKGILNESIIAEPNTGLSFSGTEIAYTELPINTNGSFSIETWFTRKANTAGTLFAFGESNNYITLEINSEGAAIVKVGEEQVTSTIKVDNTDETWKYIGLTYDHTTKAVSVYKFEGSSVENVMIDNHVFSAEAPAQGKLYVGNTADKSNGFSGATGLMQFYNKANLRAEVSDNKSTVKSGNEPNLIGLWEMNEGEGASAIDKARSRHLTLNTGWYIHPEGKALAFNGTDDYAQIPSDRFSFKYYDDFTIEFWFKGSAQTDVNLLSVGTVTHIGVNTEGELIVTYGNNTKVLRQSNPLDDQWHHLALSVKGNGMTTAIIDGTTVASFSSSFFDPQVGGGEYTLGARHYLIGTQSAYDKYLNGYIDELRVWNSALSSDVVKRNKNHKLRGDEKGLKAYYPFETWSKNINGTYDVVASDKNLVDGSSDDMITGDELIGDTAAGLIDSRPETDVSFTFVSSSNKVVLTITEELYRIEGVTLTVTADGIYDMRDNESKPAQWIAYVNSNPLNWISDPVEIVTQYGEGRTFNARIQNSSGSSADYYIDGLPGWLSVNAPSGTLSAQATKDVTFTVPAGVNVGSYETSVILIGTNDVSKILPVNLKVTGEQPDWSVNLDDFELSMNITGVIQIEGFPQEDEADILAAFIGETCVGLASPQYEPDFNSYFTYMTIGWHSGEEYDGDEVSFKLWDASTGNIYPVIEVTEEEEEEENLTVVFVGDYIYGNIEPVIFNAIDVIEQSISINKGWNWISFNIMNNNPELWDQFKENASDFGIQIKSSSAFSNNTTYGWIGALDDLPTEQMFSVEASKDDTLFMVGKPVKPSEVPITLVLSKWTWIGYTPQVSMPVAEALAGIPNPEIGDQVKGRKTYRNWSSYGWIGSMTAMEPGQGYKYKSNSSETGDIEFCYPTTSSLLRSAFSFLTNDPIESYWMFDDTPYDNNMTVTAGIFIDGMEITNGVFEVAAFVAEECRGNAVMEYIDGFTHPYMGFLMVFGSNNESVQFRIYDHTSGKTYLAEQKLDFQTDAILGTPDELYVLRSGQNATGIDNLNNQVIIYPNPVENELFIKHGLGTIQRVKIFDISGKLLIEKDKLTDSSIEVTALKTGTYFIHITSENETFVNKFIKK